MIIRRRDWTGEERESGWGTLKWKKKRKGTCHVANTSKEPTSPLEVAWWGSKYQEALLWASELQWGRGRKGGQGPSFFSSSQVCILTHAHAEHAGTILRFTTCTVHLQGSFGLSQTTQPNKHIQLQPSLPLSPPAAAAGRGPTAYTEVEQTTAG